MILGPCPHCGMRNVTRFPADSHSLLQRRCEGCARVYWLAIDQEFPCALLSDHVTRNTRGKPVLTVPGHDAYQVMGDHWHEKDTESDEWEWSFTSPLAKL